MAGMDNAERLAWLRSVCERYEGPLLRYAARLTGCREQARDVVQDAFIRLCREGPEKTADHVAEWLFTVCRNRALDLRRKDRRMTPLAPALADAQVSRTAGPPAAAEQRDSAAAVLRLLDRLPDNQQEVVRLKFQDGLSYKEIARVTSLSIGNVGFLIHTALKTLREQLADRPAAARAEGRLS